MMDMIVAESEVEEPLVVKTGDNSFGPWSGAK